MLIMQHNEITDVDFFFLFVDLPSFSVDFDAVVPTAPPLRLSLANAASSSVPEEERRSIVIGTSNHSLKFGSKTGNTLSRGLTFLFLRSRSIVVGTINHS